MPSASSPYKKVLCSVNTNTYLDNLPDAFPSLRSNLETRNPFYDVHLEWHVDMLLRNQVLQMVGLQYTSNSLRKFTKTSTHCILLHLTIWSFPNTSLNAIHVIPIIYATRAILINASRSTNTLWLGKHPKKHRKGPSNHPCEELPYEASLSALFMRCLSRRRDQPWTPFQQNFSL